MELEEFEENIGTWRGNERTLIRVFLVLFVAFILIQFVYALSYMDMLDLTSWQIILNTGQNLVVAYAITSFILGFYFVLVFKADGIVSLREILMTMLQAAVVVAVFFTILLAVDHAGFAETGLYTEDADGPEMTPARYIALLAGFFVMTLGGTFLAEVVILVGGFGIIGMLYIFEVGGAPKLIEKMEGISRREDLESKAIMWFFTIPGALDTDTMLADEPAKETSFPWDRFRTAVLWQIAFGIIIAIYVSLNPWLLRNFSMDQLFRFMSTAFVVVPILVIPWFIFRRLNARYKGVAKDFTLYAALKDRMTRLIITAGTLLIFIRMALESVKLEDLLFALGSYIFIMVLCIIAFTFIYFNFFENKLAGETFNRWSEARADREVDEEGHVDEEADKEAAGEPGPLPSGSE